MGRAVDGLGGGRVGGQLLSGDLPVDLAGGEQSFRFSVLPLGCRAPQLRPFSPTSSVPHGGDSFWMWGLRWWSPEKGAGEERTTVPPSEPSGCPRLTEAEARSERCRSVFPAPLLTNQKLSMVGLLFLSRERSYTFLWDLRCSEKQRRLLL